MSVQSAVGNAIWNFAIGAVFVLFVIYITMKGQLTQFLQLFIFSPQTSTTASSSAGTSTNAAASSAPLNTVTGQQTPFSVSNPSASASTNAQIIGGGAGALAGSPFGLPGMAAGAAAGAVAGQETLNTITNIPNLLNPANIPALANDFANSTGITTQQYDPTAATP